MKLLIIILIAGAIIYGAYAFLKSDTGKETSNFVYDTSALNVKATVTPDLAVQRAKEVYKIAINQGRDLSDGPCLDNSLIDDWVLDIAHDPRTDVDNLPENQCGAYRDGTAHHFVELDPEGNLIRAK